MAKWWTYGLSDFLMLTPQVYWRLIARYNAQWWPAQWLGIVAAGALPILLRNGAERIVWLLLAFAWGGVAWFECRMYAEIFLAAPAVAVACGVEAALLLAASAGTRPVAGAPPACGEGRYKAGMVLVAAALLFPLLAPATGHPWSEAEVFGFMPDPTALATAGVLLAQQSLRAWQALVLAVIPVASLLLGAATRWLLA